MLSLVAEEERIVGVLHDVIEDCPDWSFNRLADEGFSNAVLEALAAVTTLPHEEDDYDAFILRAATNQIGRRVKIADLKDNMDLSRISQPAEKDVKRVGKYRRALEFLGSAPAVGSRRASDA